MKDYFRQSMAWLHTWVGLLLGWLLYFMFVTGTAGYFDTEIDRWMRPELPHATREADAVRLAAHATDYLQRAAPSADRWFINIALDRNDPYPRVFWEGGKTTAGKRSGNVQFDATTGEPLQARASGGGQRLYRMHWQLHYLPETAADWIVGVATMFMLVALITGIVVHKRIFADFFTFRPGKGQRSWLDAHNVASVISLPFQLMITYSGLIFMMFTYLPFIVAAHYGGGEDGRKALSDALFEPPALTAPSGIAAPLAPLGPMIAHAEARWGTGNIRALDIRHPGDASARVIVGGDVAAGPLRAADQLVFDGVSGTLLAEHAAVQSAPKLVRDIFLGLHEGLYAGGTVRALYAFCGLLGTAMVATGLILWAVKRRQRCENANATPHPSLRLVERLNAGTIVGLPVAVAAYFWANRLIPVEFPARAEWEAHALFIVWALMLLHACLRPGRRAWSEQLWMATAAFSLLPVINLLCTERHLGHSLASGDWVFAGFDLAMLGLGSSFALAALRVRKRCNARAAGTGPAHRPPLAAEPGRTAP